VEVYAIEDTSLGIDGMGDATVEAVFFAFVSTGAKKPLGVRGRLAEPRAVHR
jgi:hypothetical protein